MNEGTASRRTHLRRAATLSLGLTALGFAGTAAAAPWPDKPVKIIVAFTAGGTTDIISRILGQELAERLKQPFVVENKPGAGGNIGTELTVRAAPDGYTITINSTGPIAVNPTLSPNLAYNPLTDLVPIVKVVDVPNVLVVPPSIGVDDFDQFIAYARRNVGKLNYGSTGVGTSSHLASYLLSREAKLDATHIPYKGAEALNDLIAGRVQYMFATIPSVIGHIRSGRLKPIAVSSAKRSRALPDVPTVADNVPGFAASSWFGMLGPAGMPQDIVVSLNRHVNEILARPDIEKRMVDLGADPDAGSPVDFGRFIREEHAKWKAVVIESKATKD